MDIKQRQLLKKYADLALKRWWVIAGCLLASLTVCVISYLSMPKIYKSESLLSYEQKQINPAKMDPEQGRSRLREALATLQEVVTSRTSLEKVILQFSLYTEQRKKLPIEDVIETMRKNIDIRPSSTGDVFIVGFKGSDPQKVVKVTNAIASLFIEENLKYREERATETSKYTESELVMAKKVLDEKEVAMRDYKLKYFNEMPEQRQSNIARLQALVEQNQGIQNSIQELERTKVMAQEQIGLHQRMAAARAMGDTSGAKAAAAELPETPGERLARLKARVSQLLLTYTENHPEVRRTKQLIDQMEAQGVKAQSGGGAPVASQAGLRESIEAQRLQMQIKEIDTNINHLKAEQTAIPPQIAQYQRFIDNAPIREAEWNSLTRDYNELRRHYDQLVAQNLHAQSAENLERNQKGSKFKIVDSARLPQKPYSPNFIKFLLAALISGLALSLGPLLIIDFFDTSFKDVGDLEEYLGVPVACAIPYIVQESELRRERLFFRGSVALVSIYGIGLVAAIVLLWKKGMIII